MVTINKKVSAYTYHVGDPIELDKSRLSKAAKNVLYLLRELISMSLDQVRLAMWTYFSLLKCWRTRRHWPY